MQTKVLRVFFLVIHSHLYSFALRFLFLQTHATSYGFRKGEKPYRKPHPLPYGLRNPYKNIKSENSQDDAQKPQWNCRFMNSAWGTEVERKPEFMNVQYHWGFWDNLESSQTCGFLIQCLHYKPVPTHFCCGVGEGQNPLVEVTVNSKEQNSLRLVSQLRPRIRPLDTRCIKLSLIRHNECPKRSYLHHRGGLTCNKDIFIITKKVILDFERSSFLPK